MSNAQQTINKMIEATLFQLTAQVSVEQFERIIKKNIAAKQQATASVPQFFDAMMLNIVYFFQNKQAWEQQITAMLTGQQVLSVEAFEQEMLTQQMQIRHELEQQQQAYVEQFHPQYEQENFTEESLSYEYAFESLAHSLRTDFLTHFVNKFADSPALLGIDVAETIHVMNGTIDYHVSTIVNQMKFA